MMTDPTTALMLTHLDIDPTGQVHPAARPRRRRQRRFQRRARLLKQFA
ncbi:hypothetical protein [Nocardioides caricicola]|uniref:Uncharacterized protein n=1 Tax=Nocardioides caricicola TaxID=634770 RepID=A0ABW0N1T0_9ACTN